MARPRNYTNEEVKDIFNRLEKYINETDIPIIAEFAYLNDIPRTTFYDYEEFSTLSKKLIDKKEAQLERKGLYGEVEKSMAIFSLKQLGWRDKPKDDEDDNLQEAFKAIADKLLDGNK